MQCIIFDGTLRAEVADPTRTDQRPSCAHLFAQGQTETMHLDNVNLVYTSNFLHSSPFCFTALHWLLVSVERSGYIRFNRVNICGMALSVKTHTETHVLGGKISICKWKSPTVCGLVVIIYRNENRVWMSLGFNCHFIQWKETQVNLCAICGCVFKYMMFKYTRGWGISPVL